MCILSVLMVCGCQSPTPFVQEGVNPLVIERVKDIKAGNKAHGKFSDHYSVVAHANGAIDGQALTNSLDAFIENYAQGTRVFEIDFELSSDNDLVLTHGWPWFNDELVSNGKGYESLSTSQFQESKIYGKYQPLTFDDVIYLLQKFPDIYFVIDSKTFDLSGFIQRYEQIIAQVSAVDKSLLTRIIPQAYDFDMALWIKNESPFKEYILTCYSIYDESNGLEIYEFVRDNQVPIVTMHMDNDWAVKVITDIYSYAYYQEQLDNFKIYIHTVNNDEKAMEILNEYHFDGIYSDDISEAELTSLKGNS